MKKKSRNNGQNPRQHGAIRQLSIWEARRRNGSGRHGSAEGGKRPLGRPNGRQITRDYR